MTPSLERIGSFTSEIGAEIIAFDDTQKLLYVVSGQTTIQVLNLSDPTAPEEFLSLDLAALGVPIAGANSVAYRNGLLAIALESATKTDAGTVAVIDLSLAETAGLLGASQLFTVGALPDMVTFTPDGSKVLVANEGEPQTDEEESDFGIDPNGSISIIDVSGDFASLSQANVSVADFLRFNGSEADLRADGVRIFPDAAAAQDFEPEYIAVSPDGTKAFVTLQENNAIAIIDITSATVEAIQPLGLKDFSIEGNGLDASDADGGINIKPQPVFGLYMPDSIASFEVDGQTYYLTANEGDDRGDADEAGRGDAIRLNGLADVVSLGRSGLALDESFDPSLLEDGNLGRLTISSIDGDLDGDGDLDQIVSYGARSFSVLDDSGNLVFDSGDQIARITAEQAPELFNANDGDPAEVDTRSDDKGAEPEAITTGTIGGRPYGFVGLERAGGGILVYDLSNPRQPEFVQYVRSDEDIAPEGLAFISADKSPDGQPLLAVANEESNTVAIYEIDIPAAAVSEIQGAAHLSPLSGEVVKTEGIVTGVAFNGFYLQGESDGDDATSDGIFVFTDAQPTVSLGDQARVFGTVSEFIPGGADTGNLSITQLTSPDVVVISSGNELPAAVVIGQSGRVAPSEIVISDDELPVNLQDESGNFDPAEDAIDFYESLEGMRVTVEDAIAISPTQVFNPFSAEAFTLPNQGATATPEGVLTARGGINLRSGLENTGDQNPERVQIQFDPTLLPEGFETPALTLGDKLGDVTGVVGYSFGNFEVNVTEAFEVTPSGLTQEVTPLAGSEGELTVASYNVLNLSALEEDDAQRSLLAEQIANNLNSPDIIGLQEIQDNDGETDGAESTVTDASETLQKLVDAIALAGGPTYAFADIAPEDDSTGGAPGSNIRNSFLYNPERVSLESLNLLEGIEAFAGSREPLVGEFLFSGNLVTVVNNHFSSRFGSTPIFGGPQPFVQAAEEIREAQAQAINNYVDGLLSDQPGANIVVLGDLNTFEFTNDLTDILPGVGDEKVLTNLVDQAIADDDAYSFIFDGNSQVLDNLFVSDGLLPGAQFDIVHVNNDFPRDDGRLRFADTVVASDHEPIVAQLTLAGANSGEPPMTTAPFQLQLLHLADQEAGIPALDDAPRASAVINALKDDYENTLILSSGDAIIPGLFFTASEAAFGGAGRADIQIQNELGIQAIAFGNHEFDLGTALVRDLIAGEVLAADLPIEEAQEVGTTPVDTASTGSFSASLAGNRLTVEGSYSDLTSALQVVGDVDGAGNPASAVHIHIGALGVNGPIFRNLTVEDEEDGSGGFSGTFDLSDEEVATLVADGLYVNLHTADNPGGELRGQIDIDLDSPNNFGGTNFPYLSSNLDFSTDDNLADLVVADDQPPQPNGIAATTVIDVNGQKIGVVGATTPTLPTISSPGDVTVNPQPFDGNPTPEQLDALAAEIQTDVDELLAANPDLNKVVLLAHMQQISIEQELATRLKNVDIIVAGGSNTRLFDENDRPRAGDTVQGEYPIFQVDADGKPVAVVNTDGNYKYIGQLVIDFDENGNIIPESYDPAVNGAYATDAEGVAALGAEGLIDPEIQAITDTLRSVIVATESNVFGVSDVYLNGLRSSVRTEETNLGNLTADANLAIAQQTDPGVVISIKNGGGIRDDIGQLIVPPGGTGEPERLPNEEIPGVKPAGGISQNDVANSLRFNNGLSLVTVTAAELLALIEHGVSASSPDDAVTPGQFPQVAGIEFSFDVTAAPGDRVQSLVVLDEAGNDADIITQDGELVGDPARTFRLVTLGFLAEGGDGYPFPMRDVINLTQPDEAARTGAATFAPDGSEQDALAEYLAANFGVDNPFDVPDTARAEDTRIQNLAFREDTVINGAGGGTGGGGGGNLGEELAATVNNLLAIAGNSITQLTATLTGRAASEISEILAIVTDDEQGTIDGLAPGSPGYVQAALERATVVLSTLATGQFDDLNPQRILDVAGGDFLQFATVRGGTLGDLLRGGTGEVIFADAVANGDGQSAIQPSALTDGSLAVGFRLPGSNRFDDITLNLTLGDAARPLGALLQGTSAEGEMIDLSGITDPIVTAAVEVFREAGFDNTVGFYTVEDQQGTVQDLLSGNLLSPGDDGYIKAALANRVGLDLNGQNGQPTQFSTELTTGKLLSTFLVANGTVDALLDTDAFNDPAVYFNHIGANADGKDHIRLLGDNLFGYEDLPGGGDMDFNDAIVKVSFA